jgi:hypothetical protein
MSTNGKSTNRCNKIPLISLRFVWPCKPNLKAFAHEAPSITSGRCRGGRPRECHGETPNEAVLGQMVTLRERGMTRRVTAADAFLHQGHKTRA